MKYSKFSPLAAPALAALVMSASVLSALTIDFNTQPIGWVGKPELSTSNLAAAGGLLFDVRFTIKDAPGPTEMGYDANNYHANNIWSGNLISNTVNRSGTIAATPNWQAIVTLESQDWDTGRVIFTSESGAGVPFRWANLSAALKTLVDPTLPATTSTILNWIRGSHNDEQANGGSLRTRKYRKAGVDYTYRLGDIIHSSPAFVGPPSESYRFTGYASFRDSMINRTKMVYVGANDGMLHAFRADTGAEVFAYIPKAVVGNLRNITATDYYTNHIYFVDGSPVTGDVCFGSCSGGSDWHTVLIGGLNSGGKAVYALEVTDPVADMTNETQAASKFLWEVTDATDLGYTFSRPSITRLVDGTWVAIFGNGYNSTSNKAILYIVKIQDGTVKKVEASGTSASGPQGLSTPTVFDHNSDGTVDYVYAGDLEGNVWKFDFTAASFSAANAGVTISYGGNPLIELLQPITSAPKVVTHPNGGYMVYIGTGKLLEESDRTVSSLHYMYGVIDNSTTTPAAGWATSTNFDLHATSSKAQNAVVMRYVSNTTAATGTKVGWKLELMAGERVVNDPVIRSGRVTFTTVNPFAATYNHNWRLGVDYLSGAAPPAPYFDANLDSMIDMNDRLDLDDDSVMDTVPVGVYEDTGVVSGPTAGSIIDDYDAIYVTHESEIVLTTNPFNDPGLPGGHFDVDNFAGENIVECYPGTPMGTTTTSTSTTSQQSNMSSSEKTAHPASDRSTTTVGPTATVVQDDADVRVTETKTITTRWNTKADGTAATGKKLVTTVIVTETYYKRDAVPTGKCHVHQYDDEANVSGINILEAAVTYNTSNQQIGYGLTPLTKIDGSQLGDKLRELDHSIYNLRDVKVIISLINPETAMATNPPVDGQGGGGTVAPGTIIMQGENGYIEVPTTQFNAQPETMRTSYVRNLTKLGVWFTNINALRATEPGCVQRNDQTYTSTQNNPNTAYRNGALVIRATVAEGPYVGRVVHETALYEHLKADTLDAAHQSATIACGSRNEDLRQYKDPDKFAGAVPGAGSVTGITVGGSASGSQAGPGGPGSCVTCTTKYLGTDRGQHNWRELIR